MTHPGQYPDAPSPEPLPAAAPGTAGLTGLRAATARAREPVLALLVPAVGSALLGLLVGLIWAAVAPRALLVAQGGGVAYVINPETSAFIVADAWFCLLTAIGGLICGVAGYFVAVRRHGPMAVAGLALGGVAASALAMWTGQQQGLAGFRAKLAASSSGAMLHEPLLLGGLGALALWPLLAALAAGTIELVSQSAGRRRTDAEGELTS